MNELNDDQLRVIEVLAVNFLNKSSDYLVGTDNGIVGVPYKKIMETASLSLEKTLLSLGWLEANGFVKHDCAIQRQTIDYLGRSNVEIGGQKIVRMFSLTEKGQSVLKVIDI
ncbi:MAG: hypothetical protein ACFFAJ_16645 [Candidatus Hodarchaeota archaeon]